LGIASLCNQRSAAKIAGRFATRALPWTQDVMASLHKGGEVAAPPQPRDATANVPRVVCHGRLSIHGRATGQLRRHLHLPEAVSSQPCAVARAVARGWTSRDSRCTD